MNFPTQNFITTKDKTVALNDTATVYGSGLLEVFATPAMVAFMENVAHESVAQYLPEGFTTVGTEINVQHLKATLVGKTVTAKSQFIAAKSSGKRLFFDIEVFEEGEKLIGKATHSRYIVESSVFMEKLQNPK